MRGNEYDIRKAREREREKREDTSHSEKEGSGQRTACDGQGDLLRDLAPLRVVNELYNLMSHYSGFRGRLRVTHIRDCKLDPNQTLDLIKC